MSQEPLRNALKAVLFRAKYRSSQEADYILGGFARDKAPALSEGALQQFAFLLSHDDPEIFAWIDAPETAPSPLTAPLLTAIYEYALTLTPTWSKS